MASKLGSTKFGTDHLDDDFDEGGGGGSCSYPAAGDVQDGVVYGGGTGTLVLPTEAQVQSGVSYGADGTEFTGTLTGGGGYPSADDVQQGVVFGASSEFTGNFVVPTPAQVQSGVSYGANGTEFTGTLTGGGGGFFGSFSFSGSFNTNTQVDGPIDVFAKPDGTKIYVLGRDADQLGEYTLSTPWDMTTATLTHTTAVGAIDISPAGIFISPDGAYLFYYGYATDKVYRLSMSVAWDLSTASLDTGQELSIVNHLGLWMSPDGTHLYVIDDYADVKHYTLSTAWNLTTGTLTDSGPAVALPIVSGLGVCFSNDGTRMLYSNSTGNAVFTGTLSTAWDTTTFSWSTEALATNSFNDHDQYEIYGVWLSPDGTKMLLTGEFGENIFLLTT